LSPPEIRERTLDLLKQKLHPKELESLQWDQYTGTTAEKSKEMVDGVRRSMDGKQNHTKKMYKILQHVENYSKIIDVAIQHQPQITALVWAGIRMGIQVCPPFRFRALQLRFDWHYRIHYLPALPQNYPRIGAFVVFGVHY
jgi:hypothetical protein